MPIKIKSMPKETVDKVQFRDVFRTPRYAIELLLPFIPKDIKTIWECANGDGHISKVLLENNYNVLTTDIDNKNLNFNFILDTCDFKDKFDAIITNPPFSLKHKFFNRCMELNVAFALLVPADYCGWIIEAVDKYGCEKIIPTRRIDFITPRGLTGATGHTSNFHSMWLTRYFNLGKTETFVELTNKQKKENI